MTGTANSNGNLDEQIFEAIRQAYRDVDLPAQLADIRRGRRSAAREETIMFRRRVVLAAAAAVVVLTVGPWLLFGRDSHGGGFQPGQPAPSATATVPGKPPRPSTSATTDAGKCAEIGRAELAEAAAAAGGQSSPPLRFTLGEGQTRVLIYANDRAAVTCWISGDEVIATGGVAATAVNSGLFPPGTLSYSSSDSGQGWGGIAFGRVPAGTTRVAISFRSGPDAVARISGEWYAYFAPAGPDSDRMATATKVTATTPGGVLNQPVEHG
jgi:hypothetical protein